MKNFIFFLALLCSSSLLAQISFNENGTGIQSATNTASGSNAFAVGENTTAIGSRSFASGHNTTALGNFSIAMGSGGSQASGSEAVAIGSQNNASGQRALALGYNTEANGYASTAMGNGTTADGNESMAIGRSVIASDYASLSIGHFNLSNASPTNIGSESAPFNLNNTAFVIGNGTNNNRSDAFKVLFNGDTTVSNDLTVSGDVVISSDARLKSNIVSLGATLSKLLLIDGKSYEKDGKQKIGVLAQEIQKVFPELVSKDDNEMLAVNYQGLVPALINALKEQQSEIEELKEQETKYKEQEQRLQRLERLVANMD